MMRFKVRDEKVSTPGIDWGVPLLELHAKGQYALWYHRGQMAWSGRGQTAYYPPNYMIVRKDGEFATKLIAVEPGRRWKVVRECLIEMIKKM